MANKTCQNCKAKLPDMASSCPACSKKRPRRKKVHCRECGAVIPWKHKRTCPDCQVFTPPSKSQVSAQTPQERSKLSPDQRVLKGLNRTLESEIQKRDTAEERFENNLGQLVDELTGEIIFIGILNGLMGTALFKMGYDTIWSNPLFINAFVIFFVLTWGHTFYKSYRNKKFWRKMYRVHEQNIEKLTTHRDDVLIKVYRPPKDP